MKAILANKRWILISCGTLSLGVSIYRAYSGEEWLEPWTAVLSAVLFLLGIFIPTNASTSTNTHPNSITMLNFFGFFNSSKVKKMLGKISILNIFSLGNKQDVEK